MTAVLGASLGVSGIRTVSLDLSTDPPRITEAGVRVVETSDDAWGSVTWTVHSLAREHNAPDTTSVLALRDKNPAEAYGVEHSDGLALVSDLGAQIGALRDAGEIVGEQTIALFDVGAGGVTVSIVDVESGRVHASRRTTVLSGDGCDAALSTFLLREYGLQRPLEPDARDLMVEMVCSAKEELSTATVATIHGPFTSGSVELHRSQLDSLIRESVLDSVTLAAAMLDSGPRVDALFAVGGGSNMQIVRQSLLDAVPVPVFTPRAPELLAARGAAGLAREMAKTSRTTGRAGRPRHSDTSSGRITRLRRSRYLGGAVAALVACGVAVSIAAASGGQEPQPILDYTNVITSSETLPSTVMPTDVVHTVELPTDVLPTDVRPTEVMRSAVATVTATTVTEETVDSTRARTTDPVATTTDRRRTTTIPPTTTVPPTTTTTTVPRESRTTERTSSTSPAPTTSPGSTRPSVFPTRIVIPIPRR